MPRMIIDGKVEYASNAERYRVVAGKCNRTIIALLEAIETLDGHTWTGALETALEEVRRAESGLKRDAGM